MKLGFHYHIPAYLQNGKIRTMDVMGFFIESLAPHFEEITVFAHSPKSNEKGVLDYTIDAENVKLVSIGKHYSTPIRLLVYPVIRKRIMRRLPDLDLMLLRGPTPLLPLIAKDLRAFGLKHAFLMVGEMIDHIDHIQTKSWKKRLVRSFIKWSDNKQRESATNAFVFSNNMVSFNKYKDLALRSALVRTTNIKKSDFFVREDTCQGQPYRLLFVGRVESEKGIQDIVEAVAILQGEGFDCQLDVVGWTSPKGGFTKELNESCTKLGISDKVILHGKKKIGEELFGFYKDADMFITASRVAEGFPRTITEAHAHSLPVLATPVGSIPHFLKDGYDMLTINASDASDIADKVRTLINNAELRRALIKNGLKTVADVTLEYQGRRMAENLHEYFLEKENVTSGKTQLSTP